MIEQQQTTKIEGKFRCSGRVGSSFSTSGTRRVALVTNPKIFHEWAKDQIVTANISVFICDTDIP